jgi:hypothetical protein
MRFLFSIITPSSLIFRADKKNPSKNWGFYRIFSSEWNYIRTHITPILTYLRTSLQKRPK